MHAAIVRGNFDEGTAAELLVLRRYLSRAAIRELAQCVAHNERDGGELLKRIAAIAELMGTSAAVLGRSTRAR